MSEFHGRCKQHFSRSVFSGISYGLCHDSFFLLLFVALQKVRLFLTKIVLLHLKILFGVSGVITRLDAHACEKTSTSVTLLKKSAGNTLFKCLFFKLLLL